MKTLRKINLIILLWFQCKQPMDQYWKYILMLVRKELILLFKLNFHYKMNFIFILKKLKDASNCFKCKIIEEKFVCQLKEY